ncbi:MAG: endonuclease III domain-containing protein [archaeon]
MNDVMKVYKFLYSCYGPQGWWPLASHKGVNPTKTGSSSGYHPGDYSFPRNDSERFEICVGAVLTQNTSWAQTEKAIRNLKSIGALTPLSMRGIDEKKLCKAIRPAGYFNQKAKKLRLFSDFYINLDGKVPSRDELLSVWGIGEETADSMLLYAFNVPTFVVDAYTKRVFSNLGLVDRDAGYDEVKGFFEKGIRKDLVVYQEYHALLVEHAKRFYGRGSDFALCPVYKDVLKIKKH